MKKLFLVSFITLLTAIAGFSQSATTLRNRCPNTSIYSVVQITGVGDINVQPCPNKTTTFTQNVVLPASTVISGGSFGNGTAASPSIKFTNSPTTGFYRSAADVLGVSTAGVQNSLFSAAVNSQRSATYTWDNVAANAEFKLSFTTGAATLGSAIIGDSTGAGKTFLSLDNLTSGAVLGGAAVTLGSQGFGNGTFIKVDDATNSYEFTNGTQDATFDVDGINNYKLRRTITAAGTTGNRTINRPNGSVNFAAGASTLVVTNSIVIDTAGSQSTIIATAQTADATCAVKNVVPAAGSFTITMTAACTAETRVAFWVFN